MTTQEILTAARDAKRTVGVSGTAQRNRALLGMADALDDAANRAAILSANAADLDAARGHISEVMLDRLALNGKRLDGMSQGIREVAALPDPVGAVLRRIERPNGLVIEKTAVPMGVIARKDRRPDGGHRHHLREPPQRHQRRGGPGPQERQCLRAALRQGSLAHQQSHCGRPAPGRDGRRPARSRRQPDRGHHPRFLLRPDGGGGLRGPADPPGRGRPDPRLRRECQGALHPDRHRHLPHVDDTADQAKALDIIENAKASRPSVCNAEEVCLVHKDIAAQFLPKLAQRLGPDRAARGLHPVELRLDPRAAAVIPGTPAGPQDFDTEFLDYILAVGVVDSVEDAVAHIAAHSTGHSDAILSQTPSHIDLFTAAVDSAAVYVNCSTRFTDGGEFGLGCEMGISTQKLHARGPMGLAELCTYKYIIRGDGQIRA